MFKKVFVYVAIIIATLVGLNQLAAVLREQNTATSVEVETPPTVAEPKLYLELDENSNWILEVNQDLVSNLGKMSKQGCTTDWTDTHESSIPVVFTNMEQTYSSVSINQDEVLLLGLKNQDVLVLTQLENGNIGYHIDHPLQIACK